MKILRKPEVTSIVGYSAVHLGRLEKANKFPKRVKLGASAVGWVESEIQDWIAARISERDTIVQDESSSEIGGAK